MSDYNRTTRECHVSQLHPELRKALLDFFTEHDLGDPAAETIACYETTSEKKDTGKPVAWLNDRSDTTAHTAMVLTPAWLIWVRHGDRSGMHLTAANLKDIQVKVHTSMLTKDPGLEVIGYVQGSKGWMRGYIGMEAEWIAQKFCDQVRQAIDKVKPPAKKRFPWQWGG
jgi:hypothetical protein